jgi:citrate/tricarballylate utilization protein
MLHDDLARRAMPNGDQARRAMLADDLVRRGRHVMTVCNACRYCEQYCPVFPALEKRRTFDADDLTYLANLCHNCGECLYACQFAPPHEFGINVPMVLAEVRAQSYEEYAWPAALGRAFASNAFRTTLAALAMVVSMLVLLSMASPEAVWSSDGSANFYGVIPHAAMVALFGGVSLFVLIAMVVAGLRFWRDARRSDARRRAGALPSTVASAKMEAPASTFPRRLKPALYATASDALTLRHLHGAGLDCASNLEVRLPWRRWFHHCTFYGFLLCMASTTVAAIYHSVLGWHAPYPYSSLPVLLGAAGGFGLVVGPLGLAALRQTRDPSLGHRESGGLDTVFLTLLFLTSLTGLALLVLRHSNLMGLLLVIHLAVVLVLLLTLPYGKFVHALYRVLALIRYHDERE